MSFTGTTLSDTLLLLAEAVFVEGVPGVEVDESLVGVARLGVGCRAFLGFGVGGAVEGWETLGIGARELILWER